MTESEAIKEVRFNMSRIGLNNKSAKRVSEAKNIAIQALEEVQKYREIGSIEEFRAAREKQIAKKPIMKPYFDDMEEEYLCCPTCGEILTDRIPLDNKDFYFHCLNCGQKLNWGCEE